jgi:hypothetical protein
MNIYLASRYSRRQELMEYAAVVESLGHIVTSRWLFAILDAADNGTRDTLTDSHRQKIAEDDWQDLENSQICISFTEPPGALGGGRGGRHTELGGAIALKQRCIIVGSKEHIFHYLNGIEFYSTWEECLQNL